MGVWSGGCAQSPVVVGAGAGGCVQPLVVVRAGVNAG